MTNQKIKKPTIRSHYISKTYLKHFLLDDTLFMYKKGKKFFNDKITAEERILKITGENGLTNVGLENNLYRIDVPGLTSDDIEEIFRECGENFFDEVVSQIEDKKEGESIAGEIKNKLCIFLAAMRVRTPLFKWEIEEMDSTFRKYFASKDMQRTDVSTLKNEMEKIGKNYTDEQITITRQAIIDKKYELKYPNTLFLKAALFGLDWHANIFHGMKMVILKSRADRYFITSDNPVVYFVPKEKVNFYNQYKSLVSPYTEVFFTITKNIAIHLSRRDEKEIIMKAERNVVDLFNENISHNSFNFLFSPLKMKILNKFTEEYIPYPFRVRIR